MLDRLVKAAAPNMPEDRHVKATQDPCVWYKIINSTRTLMVPLVKVLRTNPMELDRFAEACRNFESADLESTLFDWEHLNLTEYTGDDIPEAVRKLREQVLASELKTVGVDIETRQVFWEDNCLLSIGVAYDESSAVAFYNFNWNNSETLKALTEFFTDPDIVFVWQNGKFDCGRLRYLQGIPARIDEDTLLRHYISINERKGSHGLKEMGQLYLQAPAWDDELDEIKRKWCRANKVPLKEFMYDSIPTSVLIPYMQRDCIATLRLHWLFKKLARPESEFMYRQLVRASNVYMNIELAGQQIDVDYLEDLEFELDNLVNAANKKLDAVASRIWDPELYKAETGAKSATDKFSVGSPKQLKWMLQRVLGYPVPSTDATLIQNLLLDVEAGRITNPDAKEFLESIGDVRKYSKYLETYALGIRRVLCRDGRVRCTFNLHGTETGRLSSSGPNMQNIPRNKMIKNLIIATPGYKLLQLDYSQAELRVLAMLSGDEYMTQVYVDGKDLHDSVAEEMFGPGFDKEQRNMAKTINFGIAYGRGPGSISEKFGKTMAESREIIEKWFAPMPKVKAFINNRRQMANRGEPCTTFLGRERHFVITNDNINHVQNEYINTPIQSIASDFTMLSLLDIADLIEQKGWPARIVTTVHDSIILEVKDGDPELMLTIASACKSIMANTPKNYKPDIKVPFKADADVGYKWGEMVKMDPATGLEMKKDE
jgi:DNA polymerase I-like protein with 3'-5' exonuclease and polymerase domains